MIALTLTMIGGVITVVTLIVTRMPLATTGVVPSLPDTVTLPDGATARAVTIGQGWFAVVTTGDVILIYNTDGTLRQTVPIK